MHAQKSRIEGIKIKEMTFQDNNNNNRKSSMEPLQSITQKSL